MSVVYHGERFAGYRLVAVIGSTALATVHRAVDPEGRTVALTILDGRPDELTRQRFLRETAIARDLRHPHIAPIHETGEAEGRLFVAERYVPGVDLGTLLARGPSLDPDRAVGLLTGIAAALDAAHTRGLVHGDVTPVNILVDTLDGIDHAYLTGFGVASSNAPEYLAPEQVDRTGVDARTDVYSLGRVLHRCLSTDPSRRFSTGLDEIVARAVARRKEDRYPTATAFVAAVRRAIAEPGYRDPAAAALLSRPAVPRPPWVWSRLVVAGLSAAVLAATTGLALGLHRGGSAGASNAASATALAPRIPTTLLAPRTAPTPEPTVRASATPGPTPTAPPTPDATLSAPATSPPPAPTQPPLVTINPPPLSGGNLFYATVRNTGATDLVAGASRLSNSAMAAIVTDGCAGARLVPGASCLVTVRMQPSAPGVAASVLSVPLSDGKPVTFTLNAVAP